MEALHHQQEALVLLPTRWDENAGVALARPRRSLLPHQRASPSNRPPLADITPFFYSHCSDPSSKVAGQVAFHSLASSARYGEGGLTIGLHRNRLAPSPAVVSADRAPHRSALRSMR